MVERVKPLVDDLDSERGTVIMKVGFALRSVEVLPYVPKVLVISPQLF